MPPHVFHDLENCAKPKSFRACRVVNRIEDAVIAAGYPKPEKITAVIGMTTPERICGEMLLEYEDNKAEYEERGVYFTVLNSEEEQAVDNHINNMLMADKEKGFLPEAPGPIVIIAGDHDYLESVIDLKDRGYEVLLIYTETVDREMLKAASRILRLSDLFKGDESHPYPLNWVRYSDSILLGN